MKEEIQKILEDTFKSRIPDSNYAPEKVQELAQLLADATAAYVMAIENSQIDVNLIQDEYLAQVQVKLESLRFEALNQRVGASEIVILLSKIIPILMRA